MADSAVPILPSRNLDETLEFYSRLGFELQGAPIEKYRYLIIGRLRHGAGVEKETTDADEAYARFPELQPTKYRDGWLP
jgi:hypothetical protein